jgi:DNA-directed RNA polymerase subunit RPC12/RpoP
LRERRREIQSLSLDDRDGLDLVDEYPDHPEAGAALEELLNGRLPYWALPPQIHRTWSAIERYEDYLPDDEVEERIEELKKRDDLFKWHDLDTTLALASLIAGVFLIIGSFSAPTPSVPLIFALVFLAGGGCLQYFHPGIGKRVDGLGESYDGDYEWRERGSTSSESTNRGKMPPENGYPAGTWRCPNCGNEKRKGDGYTGVMCQECRREMQFVGENERDKGSAPTTENTSSRGEGKKVWKCDNCSATQYESHIATSVECAECGSKMRKLGRSDSSSEDKQEKEQSGECNHKFESKRYGTEVCMKCGRSKSFLKSKPHNKSSGKNHQSESGCAVAFQFILLIGGLWLAMQTCSM